MHKKKQPIKIKRFDKPRNWLKCSVEELGQTSYGEPDPTHTGLIKRCLAYVKLPVGSLNAGQLRTLLSQKFALPYLIPLALDILKEDVLVQGNFFPGDLLESVARAGKEFWQDNPDLFAEFDELVKANADVIEEEGLQLN